ncbi:hypothetical protein [Amphiplicatus metriothermophilus]|uniref:Acyl-coenzyme A thioesterase PaaI, contains HGG motif n=1 Tax=Amphiplicatus metriothermophilus TaxID=1519374 RepID=A0A239PYX5_9PROT|nr:hypothetical protein [Amphiplicatus metriothermophilus]MBB5518194.1 hypothetical protein [Amphiplicatus metriothermophilus]SNT75360.1 hypothetical protein SAMN06297382_2698 [Amphiplicatus metriothermophilus]
MPEGSRPAPVGAIVIEERYCGPRGSANGGYASGALAAFLDGPAEATLKAPPPLGRPLDVVASDGAVAAFDGETLIATARPAAVAVDLPAIPDAAAVDEARQAYLADPQSAIFPYCFVCGPRRPEGEGLRIFAGAIPESPINAGWWTPGADLADGDGLVRGEFLWAALDCPSAFALRRTGGLVLLGRLAAEIRRRPKPGERLLAMAWKTREEGRKQFADSALLDAHGEIIAAANALWIEVNDPQLLNRLRSENE